MLLPQYRFIGFKTRWEKITKQRPNANNSVFKGHAAWDGEKSRLQCCKWFVEREISGLKCAKQVHGLTFSLSFIQISLECLRRNRPRVLRHLYPLHSPPSVPASLPPSGNPVGETPTKSSLRRRTSEVCVPSVHYYLEWVVIHEGSFWLLMFSCVSCLHLPAAQHAAGLHAAFGLHHQ